MAYVLSPRRLGLTVLVGLVSANLARAAVEYKITDLGTLGGAYSIPFSVNDAGQVVGKSAITPPNGNPLHDADIETDAFLYSGDTITDLGTLGGYQSVAFAINDSGLMVGQSDLNVDPPGSVVHAFVDSNGMMTDIGTLGGSDSFAHAVNGAGMVVGEASTSIGMTHAFLYSGGTISDLGTLGGASSVAQGINAPGQVVGYSDTVGGAAQHAFLYSDGKMTDLGTLGGTDSYAFSINASGNIVGQADTAGDATQDAFLYSDGKMIDLGNLGGGISEASDINDLGQIVGFSWTPAGPTSMLHAFLYFDGTMTDLNSLLPPDSGWSLSDATGINDNGQIVGDGLNPNGQDDAFLLTPVYVPEPSAHWSAALISVALTTRRRCQGK